MSRISQDDDSACEPAPPAVVHTDTWAAPRHTWAAIASATGAQTCSEGQHSGVIGQLRHLAAGHRCNEFEHFAASLPRLRTLTALEWSNGSIGAEVGDLVHPTPRADFRSAGAAAVALAALTNLRRLQLPPWVTPGLAHQTCVDSLGNLARLTFLSCSPNEEAPENLGLAMSAALLSVLQAMTALAELRLPRLQLVGVGCRCALLRALAPALAGLPALTAVHLRCVLDRPMQCDLAALAHAVALFPALQHLDVDALEPPEAALAGIADGVRALPSLTHLGIRCEYSVDVDPHAPLLAAAAALLTWTWPGLRRCSTRSRQTWFCSLPWS
jgi:hypothetical protein